MGLYRLQLTGVNLVRQDPPTMMVAGQGRTPGRVLAREREGVTLAPPIVVRDELESGVLVERCQIPQLTESFSAIIQNRR